MIRCLFMFLVFLKMVNLVVIDFNLSCMGGM